nr:hypothetical protein [Verrucomicrobiota bacterium]
MKHLLSLLLLFSLVVRAAAAETTPEAARPTRVSLRDGRWHLNGEVTYRGARAGGLLLNVRMVNATF